MASMHNIFVSIRVGNYRGPGNAAEYRRAKLTLIVGEQARHEDWHDLFLADEGKALPLADPAQEKSYSHATQTALSIRKSCALSSLSEMNLLTDGETLESAYFSFLTEAVGEQPAGTAVYVQRTNLADVYFLLPGAQVTDSGRLALSQPMAEVPAQRPLLRADSEWVSLAADTATTMVAELVKQKLEAKAATYLVEGLSTLAGGIAGGILGAILGGVVNLIFSSNEDDYLKDLAEQFEKIVNQAVRQNTVDEISSAISQVNTMISVEYIAKRKEFMGLTGAVEKDPKVQKIQNRDHLFKLLVNYTNIQSQNGGISYLQSDNVAKVALPIYMLGLVQLLALYQEMAMVDPTGPLDPKTGLYDPTKSGYVTDAIPAMIDRSLPHIQNTWKKIKEDRMNKIEYPTFITSYNRYVSGDVQVIKIHGLKDNYDDTKIKMNSIGYDEKERTYSTNRETDAQAIDYKMEKLKELTRSLSDPDSLIQRLKELRQNPMGKVEIT